MQANSYTPRYIDFIDSAGITVSELPAALQELILRFIAACGAWEREDAEIRKQLQPILILTDAFIAATIDKAYGQQNEHTQVDIDKLKLLAFKAKALQQKWKK